MFLFNFRVPVKVLELVVYDLVEKSEYEFRVSAQNKVGLGEPSGPSKRVVAKLPYSKFRNRKILVPR